MSLTVEGMGQAEAGCQRCGGWVVADRLCAHPSGITVEYGRCVRCDAALRRIVSTDGGRLSNRAGRWIEIAAESASHISIKWRARSPTRPPRRPEKHRSAR
jgi:hypothetical protein